MRLGGKIFEKVDSPEQWVEAHRKLGYRAAYCPLDATADDATVSEYVSAAADGDLVIAEVGAWSNPISRDGSQAERNIAKCIGQLELAERVGARCCVNISGSRGPKWNGPDPANITSETFDIIVRTVQRIVDAVEPRQTCYTLEMLGWSLPDSAESYLKLIEAIDRDGFAVHLDPVNIVNSPRRYYENASLLQQTIRALGPRIRSVHAKDVQLADKHLVHLDECRPGLGALDYTVFLKELDQLQPDLPLMLEHLPSAEEYAAAAEYIRGVAGEAGISL
jgi:sugar phosphate isomerase/epimerase